MLDEQPEFYTHSISRIGMGIGCLARIQKWCAADLGILRSVKEIRLFLCMNALCLFSEKNEHDLIDP